MVVVWRADWFAPYFNLTSRTSSEHQQHNMASPTPEVLNFDEEVDFQALAMTDPDFAKFYDDANGHVDFKDPKALQQVIPHLAWRCLATTDYCQATHKEHLEERFRPQTWAAWRQIVSSRACQIQLYSMASRIDWHNQWCRDRGPLQAENHWIGHVRPLLGDQRIPKPSKANSMQ